MVPSLLPATCLPVALLLQEVTTHPMDCTPVLSPAAQNRLMLQRVPYRAVPSFGGSEERHGKRLHLSGFALETFLP